MKCEFQGLEVMASSLKTVVSPVCTEELITALLSQLGAVVPIGEEITVNTPFDLNRYMNMTV